MTAPWPPRLVLLTDRLQLPSGRTLVDTVAACVDAGLEAVVLRELDLPARHRAALVLRLAATGVDVVVARAWSDGAVAVHLASAQDVVEAGRAPRHGRSCHTEDEVARAVTESASYVTVSPVGPSRSKPGYGPALGTDGVRRAVAAADGTPVLALGGVDVAHVAGLREAGAHGVAVMGAVMRAADPAPVVSRLLQQVG